MKNILLTCTLIATALFIAGCSKTDTANKTTNTATTTTTTTNTTNRPAQTNTTNTTNTATTNTSNTSSSTNSPQGGAQDFILVNATGVEIDKLYVAPHDSDDWEEDILGRDTLPNGETLEIKFNRNEKAAMWDLRIEDSKGTYVEWENLNLLEISKITLRIENGKPIARTE